MNKKQRIILFLTAAIIVAMFLYPPVCRYESANRILPRGFRWLAFFYEGTYTVNYHQFYAQFVVTLGTSACLVLVCKSRKNDSN